MPPFPSRALALVALAGLASCTSLEGELHSRGGAAGTWDLRPDRCASGGHVGYRGVDLYTGNPKDDTEVVVIAEVLSGGAVLVRVPGAGHMIRLTASECSVFQLDAHTNGVRVNGVPSLSGSVVLDCERADLGHVTGQVSFTCT